MPGDASCPATIHVTTSWDDGVESDFRVVELMGRHGIKGTFYVCPRNRERSSLTERQVERLAVEAEIGAHTITHRLLTQCTLSDARHEIEQSKRYIEGILAGGRCPMFCPPGGRFHSAHLDLCAQAGFLGVRTVEQLSTAPPRRKRSLAVMATTLQVYPHPKRVFLINILKRGALRNLRWLRWVRSGDLVETAKAILNRLQRVGGVFHLWGHSWEIEQRGLWNSLEEVFELLRACRNARFVTNSELLAVAGSPAALGASKPS